MSQKSERATRSLKPRCIILLNLSILIGLPGIGFAQEFTEPALIEPAPAESTEKDASSPADSPASSANELADLSLEELASTQVVVTGSRREQRIGDLPYAFSVITHNDMRAAGVRSIPDALRLAAGVDVADLSYGQSAVSPRGMHGFLTRSVLVLVDGRQIFDSLFGGTVWGAWPFQLEDIERIEVIRGPGGVIWGANAQNGVINIITKDPRDQQGTTLSLGGASRGSQKSYLGHGLSDQGFRFRVSGEFETSDGFNQGGNLLGRLADEYRAARGTFMGIYEIDPANTLSLSGGSAVMDDGFPRSPLGGFGPDWKRESGTQASFLLGKWTHRIEKDNELELTGYVNDFYGSPGLPQIDYRYQQFSLQLRHSIKPVEDHSLTWGVDTRADLLDATNSSPHALSKDFVGTGIVGAYAQDDWNFAPNWWLGLGGRIDYEFYGGFQPSARASLMHRFDDGSRVYGAVSRAFQMPSAGLRFLDIPLLNGISVVEGKRDLDSETLVAYELGYSPQLGKNLDANINVFWNEYADLTTLTPRLGPPGLLAMDLDNRADATIYGVELDAKYALTPKVTLLGNYTFQNMDWRSSVGYHEKDLMSPPMHKAMIGARYSPTTDLRLSSHLYFVDDVNSPNVGFPFAPKTIDSYFRLDLKLEKDLWKKRATLSAGVRNLLDANHPEGGTLFLNNAETPRMFFVELRIGLDP